MSNQSDARERAYRSYEQIALSGVDKREKDDAWARYQSALSKDPGAAQAPKRH